MLWIDLLVVSTFAIPGIIGLTFGWAGWRAGAFIAAGATFGVPSAVFVWGILPATGCRDCTEYALFLPYVWFFVLMISGLWIVAIPAALGGWAAGHWARTGSVAADADRV